MAGRSGQSSHLLPRAYRSALSRGGDPAAVVEDLVRDTGLPRRAVLQFLVWGLRRRPEDARQLLLEAPAPTSGRPQAVRMTTALAQQLVNDAIAGPAVHLPGLKPGTTWTKESLAAFLATRGIHMEPSVAVRQLAIWGSLIDNPGLTLRGINATISRHHAASMIDRLTDGPAAHLPGLAPGTPWTEELLGAFQANHGVHARAASVVQQLAAWGQRCDHPGMNLQRLNANMRSRATRRSRRRPVRSATIHPDADGASGSDEVT